jgi:molybdopterin-guanine dinucleotide biosynthesis protein A
VSDFDPHIRHSNSHTPSGRALGVVLAGGRGERIGGGKAAVDLGGRPLASYPLDAMAAAGLEAVVCAKPGEELPALAAPVLVEPAEPRHPLCGVLAALEAGKGRAVVVAACDLPFVPPPLLAFLAGAREPLVVPAVGGRLHPLLARYDPALLPDLEAALEREEPLTRTVERLRPRLLAEDELARFGDPGRILFNVNDRDDLRRAEALL